jgi:hypothetical protein
VFVPLFTALANRIFDEGLPAQLKVSIVKPLYKKGKLNPEEFSSYRPVANIPFLSKVVEKLVAKRLTQFLEVSGRTNPNQHAYRALHSCETALHTMLNEAFMAMDKGEMLHLVLLDLTAAFDIVDHDLLLVKCKKLGISDSALNWLASYLHERCQKVSCLGHESQLSPSICGVPQGSILGPLLFTVFMSEISVVINQHGMMHVLYADDIQVYVRSTKTDIPDTLLSLEVCLDDVSKWLTSQKLILNLAKCEFISFSSRPNFKFISNLEISLCDRKVKSSTQIRDLGIILDTHLTLNPHVSKIRKQAFLYLRLISKARRYMSKRHAALLVDSLAVSRINFGVSLLTGLSKANFSRLQSILNYGIRIVEGLKKRESITSHLHEHKWLDVSSRTRFRLSQIVHIALLAGAPAHLASLLQPAPMPSVILRSENDLKLLVPRTRTKMGDRSFAVAGTTEYNAIPVDIRKLAAKSKFKSRLKLHYLSKFC